MKAEAKAKFDQMLSDKTPPPFEWNESAGSPGVTLTATETNRMAGPRGPVAMFAMSANGFGADEDLTFWTKWLDGKYMRMSGVSLSEKGVIQSVLAGKAAPMGVAVGTMAPGEPISWALASSSGKVAYARAVVYPIESRSGGGCSVSAELASPSGLLFHVSFRGFKPGEELTLSNEFKNESASSPGHADDKGGFDFPVEFSENDHGKAGVSAVGKDCKVSVGYKVGPEALAKR